MLERDIDLAIQDVREKISIIRTKLPTDIDEPIVEKVDPDATPVLWFALHGDKSVRDLSTYADEILKEQLQENKRGGGNPSIWIAPEAGTDMARQRPSSGLTGLRLRTS